MAKREKKEENDKFYTLPEVAKHCAEIYSEFAEGFIVEPSAGSGVFAPYVNLMLDLVPEGPNIIQQDFFKFDTTQHANYLGNPPFGRNSSLAKDFFNHAAKGKGTIGFIVPLTFRKVSVQNDLDLNFHLVKEELLEDGKFVFLSSEYIKEHKIKKPKSFTLHGEPYFVPCVFQVWQWREEPRTKIILPTEHDEFHFVDPDDYDYDFAIRRVGGLAGKVLNVGGAKPSHYFLQAETWVQGRMESLYDKFQEVAKNTAGNPSLGKGELISIYSEAPQ